MLILSFFIDINYIRMVLLKCKFMDIYVFKVIFCKDYILCFILKKFILNLK